eukprot:8601799-Lingulodinium_polyedra.AAC.1
MIIVNLPGLLFQCAAPLRAAAPHRSHAARARARPAGVFLSSGRYLFASTPSSGCSHCHGAAWP